MQHRLLGPEDHVDLITNDVDEIATRANSYGWFLPVLVAFPLVPPALWAMIGADDQGVDPRCRQAWLGIP